MRVDLLHVTSHVKLEKLHFDVVAGILVSVRSCSRGQHSLGEGKTSLGKEHAAGIRRTGAPPGGGRD